MSNHQHSNLDNSVIHLQRTGPRTIVNLTTTVHTGQQHRTEANGVLIKSSSNSDSVSLANMQSSALVLWIEWPWASPIHIKAISLSAFLLSTVVSCKGGQRNVFKQPRTLKFPPKPGSSVCSVVTIVAYTNMSPKTCSILICYYSYTNLQYKIHSAVSQITDYASLSSHIKTIFIFKAKNPISHHLPQRVLQSVPHTTPTH